MAIYEYDCQDCGTKFQARRQMKDADAPIACPQCGGARSKRGLSTFFASTSSSSGTSTALSGGSGCGSCSRSSCSTCGGH
jgi:putative FmdB family regulatory protein